MGTVIFDFDGTIADSIDLMVDLYNEHASYFGYDKLDKKEFSALRKMSYIQALRYKKIKIHLIPRILVLITKEMKKRIDEVHPHPGIKEVLKKLKSKEYSIGILTSNDELLVKQFVKKYNFPKFDFILSEKSLFGKDKALKRIMKKYQLDRDNVLYIGDESRDIVASNKAHISVIGVDWGIAGKEGLEQHSPNRIVHDSNELYRAILSIFTSGR